MGPGDVDERVPGRLGALVETQQARARAEAAGHRGTVWIPPVEPVSALEVPARSLVLQRRERLAQQAALALASLVDAVAVRRVRAPAQLRDPQRSRTVVLAPHEAANPLDLHEHV